MKALLNFSLLMSVVLLVSGCAGSSKPSLLQRSMEVNKIVESSSILPDHKYYYAGPQDKPDTIVGIHTDYEFITSVHWNAIDLTEKHLQSWNIVISNDTRVYLNYNGSYIMTPDGKQAGIFYSKYDFTKVQYPAPNQIRIYKPDPTPDQRRREQLHGGSF